MFNPFPKWSNLTHTAYFFKWVGENHPSSYPLWDVASLPQGGRVTPKNTPLFSWTLRKYSYEKWRLDVKPFFWKGGWSLKRICLLFKWWLFFFVLLLNSFFQVLEHLPRVLLRRQGQVGEDGAHGWCDPKGSGNSPWTFGDFIHPRQGKRLECARVTRFLPTARICDTETPIKP